MKYKKDEELKSANERAVMHTAGDKKPDLNAQNLVMNTVAGQKPDLNAQNFVMNTAAGQNNNQGASHKQFGTYQPEKTGQQKSAGNNSFKPMVNAESQAWNDAIQQERNNSTANVYYDNADGMEKPEFTSQYDSQISGLVDKILNGEKFDYDVNSDALFANYADVYERNARKAAEDAMGRGAAASGGYGSSYAQALAGQAYNSQMQNLNAAVPQLQELAYQQYQAQKQDEYNQLNMLQGLDNSDYAKYRDSMSDYHADREFERIVGRDERADLESDREFERILGRDERADYESDRDFNAEREDTEWEHGRIEDRDDRADYESDRDFNADREDTEWEHGRIEDRDDRADYESDRAFDADREDTEWEHGFAEDQFAHDKAVDDRAQNMEEAIAAAEYGNYKPLEWYTGADFSDREEWDKIMRGAELYSATGLVDYLKAAGVDTTYIEDKMADDDFAYQLSIGLSVYEATGSPAMLNELGIDTSYMDKMLGYMAKQEENAANGSSGGSGGGSYSGGSSGGASGGSSGGGYSEPAVWGDMTAADIASEVAYHFMGSGVAWNSRTVSEYIRTHYPGLSIDAHHQINAYMADPDSGLEELMYTGMSPRV